MARKFLTSVMGPRWHEKGGRGASYLCFSPVLGLLGNVHGKVAQGDLHVQDSRHGVGHHEVGGPRPGALPSK